MIQEPLTIQPRRRLCPTRYKDIPLVELATFADLKRLLKNFCEKIFSYFYIYKTMRKSFFFQFFIQELKKFHNFSFNLASFSFRLQAKMNESMGIIFVPEIVNRQFKINCVTGILFNKGKILRKG